MDLSELQFGNNPLMKLAVYTAIPVVLLLPGTKTLFII